MLKILFSYVCTHAKSVYCYYFIAQIFHKKKKKFNQKKFMMYKRMWNINQYNIQDIVRDSLQSKSNVATSILPRLEEDNASNTSIPEVIRNSPYLEFGNNIRLSDEEIDTNTALVNFSSTPTKNTLRPICKSFNEDIFEHVSPVIKKDINEIEFSFNDNCTSNDNSNSLIKCNQRNSKLSDNAQLSFNTQLSDHNCVLSDSSDSSIKCNQRNSKLSTQKKFIVLQGRFRIQRNIIIDEHEIINTNKIREEIQHNMVHTLSFPCPLKFYGGIRRNINSLVTYAKCRYDSHVQQFKFDIANMNAAIFDIFVSSTKCTEILHEGSPIFCTLKGDARVKTKMEMCHMTPRMLQLKTLKSLDHELAQDGYLQDLRMLSTYQKAKSEENTKNDLHLCSYDLSDLFQQYIIDQQSPDPYIQNVSLPFHVYMFSEEQINLLEKTDIIYHFDSTGSVVRKPNDIKCKRVYYYVIVVNKNNTILPIAEMVTAVHDTNAISIFLKTFRHFVRTKHLFWPCSVIVVDWSWALMNSLMNELNKMTVSEYLDEVYLTISKKDNLRPDLIVVHSCCAHFQKRVSCTIHKQFFKYLKIKNLILECMGTLIHCDSLDDLDFIYEQFMTILLTFSSETAKKCIININEHIAKCKYNDNDNNDNNDHNDFNNNADEFGNKNDKIEGRIFLDSPFFKRYSSKLHELRKNINENAGDDAENNEYYAPEIADYITNHYMPFVPMWSALLLKLVASNEVRLSNANVEGYFNIIKHQVLNNEINLKVGRFVRKMKNYTRQICAEIKLNIPLKRRRKRTIRRNVQNLNDSLIEETWKRKRKSNNKYSHFEGRSLGRIVKKRMLESSTPVSNKNSTFNLSELNLSENSTHANALSNGLFLDVDYYMASPESTFTIGQFGSIINAPIIGYDTYNLIAEEFFTLKDKNWIDGKIIDCFAISLLNSTSNSIAYIPTNYTYYMIGDFYEKRKDANWRMYNIKNVNSDIMLLPYLYNSHWYLLIINLNKNTILHLDPKYLKSPDKKRAITVFKNYLKESSLLYNSDKKMCDKPFREITCTDRPLQNDAYNCGIYVIYYINCIIRNELFDKNFKLNDYRTTIAEILLTSSKCMKEVCQYCFNVKNVSLVMCNTCRRWVHQLCLRKIFNDNTNWDDPKAKYRCLLCKKGFRPWMKYVK